MDESEFLSQLALCIRAHYPLILVESADDEWIVDSVNREFKEACAVTEVSTVDADILAEAKGKQAVLLWTGASVEDWNASRKLLQKHARRVRTNTTLIMVGQGWSGIDTTAAILRAPLPSAASREIIARLSLGIFAKDPERLARIVFTSAGMTRAQLYRTLSKATILRRADASFDNWEALISAEKKSLMSRDSTLEIIEDKTALSDVGGVGELKTWLRQRTAAFSAKARSFGISAPRGLLIVGVQGCGKSLLAKAVASEWNFPLLRLDMSSIFAKSGANPDSALASALDVADAMAPAVIWCDEIEKAFSENSDPTTKRLLGHILNWLQERQSRTFFVATANDVQVLPPELMRKGRFDEIFFVDLPDADAREEIFAIHLRRRGRDPKNFDCARLSDEARNFSGAEIEQTIMDALFAAFSKNRELTTDDISDAIQDTVPLYKQREDDIKRLREWASDRTRGAEQNRRLLGFFK